MHDAYAKCYCNKCDIFQYSLKLNLTTTFREIIFTVIQFLKIILLTIN